MSSDGSRLSGTSWRRRNASARRRGRGRRGRRGGFLGRPHFPPVAALIVDNGSCLSMAGFAVLVLLTLYSLRLFVGFSCSASWTVWTRTTALIVHSSSILAVAYARLVLLVSSRCVPLRCRQAQGAPHHGLYAPEGRDDAPRAVLPFIVVGPKMFGIMAGMTPNDGSSEEYRKIGFYWEMTSYVSVFCSFWFDGGYIFRQSTEAWLFHALLREGGPRIPILRSIPPCAGGFWTIFTVKLDSFPKSILDTCSCVSARSLLDEFQNFPDEGGFGSCSRALQMMGGVWLLPHLAAFFALRPHGRECPRFVLVTFYENLSGHHVPR